MDFKPLIVSEARFPVLSQSLKFLDLALLDVRRRHSLSYPETLFILTRMSENIIASFAEGTDDKDVSAPFFLHLSAIKANLEQHGYTITPNKEGTDGTTSSAT